LLSFTLEKRFHCLIYPAKTEYQGKRILFLKCLLGEGFSPNRIEADKTSAVEGIQKLDAFTLLSIAFYTQSALPLEPPLSLYNVLAIVS